MTRKLKVGFALIAVLALSAVAAGAAQAEYTLTPAVSPATILGEQIKHEKGNKFEITAKGTKIECPNGTTTFEATTEAKSVTDVTVKANYPAKACLATGGLVATIDTNGCTYTLTGETNGTGQGIIHLVCPEGKAVEVTIPEDNCTIKVHGPNQTPTSGGITYTNNEANKPDDVEATIEAKGITYERVGTTAGCIASVPKEGNDLDLLTKITLRAFEDKDGGPQVNLTVS